MDALTHPTVHRTARLPKNSPAPVSRELRLRHPGLEGSESAHHLTHSYKVGLHPLSTRQPGDLLEMHQGVPGGTVAKNPPANAGVTGLVPRPGRFHTLRSI